MFEHLLSNEARNTVIASGDDFEQKKTWVEHKLEC